MQSYHHCVEASVPSHLLGKAVWTPSICSLPWEQLPGKIKQVGWLGRPGLLAAPTRPRPPQSPDKRI